MFHYGHLRLLERAKEYGDFLTVGIVIDSSVQELKGVTRPIIPQYMRYSIIKALKCVDEVFLVADFEVPPLFIEHFDVFVFGEDQDHIMGKELIPPEKQIVWLPREPSVSTSDIIKRIKNESC